MTDQEFKKSRKSKEQETMLVVNGTIIHDHEKSQNALILTGNIDHEGCSGILVTMRRFNERPMVEQSSSSPCHTSEDDNDAFITASLGLSQSSTTSVSSSSIEIQLQQTSSALRKRQTPKSTESGGAFNFISQPQTPPQSPEISHISLTEIKNIETRETLLHVLTNSESSWFLSGVVEKAEKFAIIEQIVSKYPQAFLAQNSEKQIPFQKIITDWLSQCNEISESTSPLTPSKSYHNLGRYLSPTKFPFFSPIGPTNKHEMWKSQPKFASKDGTTADEIKSPDFSAEVLMAFELLEFILESLENSESQSTPNTCYSFDSMQKQNASSPESCNMNSRSLESNELCEPLSRRKIARQLLSVFATQNSLVPTLLRVHVRTKKIGAQFPTFTSRLLDHPEAIGPWLRGHVSDQSQHNLAFHYIERLNIVHQRMGSSPNQTSKDINPDQALANLPDFIPSLLQFETRRLEEIATMPLISDVLDRVLSKAFSSFVIFMDGLLLGILIFGFRGTVYNHLMQNETKNRVFMYLTNVAISYFIVRETGKFLMISQHSNIYLRSFWHITDGIAILLSLLSSLMLRYNRGDRILLAITTAFLWLRVLSFLKGFNRQLATFVLAILQITKDILWFCGILFVLVTSFAQIFFTLMVPEACAEGSTDDETQGSQDCKPREYYLKVYAILLGDFGLFERDQFHSSFSVFLAVTYSFMVVLVLLNVLIAVASDSYEKCLFRSRNLFGRARVMLISELVSFQSLLQEDKSQARYFWWIFWGLTFMWIAGEVLGHFISSEESTKLGVVLNVLSILTNVVIITVLQHLNKEDSTLGLHNFQLWIQGWMQRVLASSSSSSSKEDSSRDSSETQWNGRLAFLQDELNRHALQAEKDRAQHLKYIEALLTRSKKED